MKPMLRIAAALCWVLLAGVACGESDINLATLNCYWFFDAQEGKGDIDKAMADYREALRINPKFDTAQENLEALRLLKAKKGR